MARTLSRNPSSATSANQKSTSANKQSTVRKTRSSRSTGRGRENQSIDGEEVSVPVRAVADDEPEAVTNRVSKQTAQSGGKRHTPQSSDDDESVAWPVKHPHFAKKISTNKSSQAQQTWSTHSMARRSQFVDGTFSQINSSLCTAVMHLSSQLL